MKIKRLVNRVANHNSLYGNFEVSYDSDVVVFDEPYGFRLLFKTWMYSFFVKYILIIHNCNTWLDLASARKGTGLKFAIKRIFRKSLMRRKESVVVVGKKFKDYMSINGENNVVYLPFIRQVEYETCFPEDRLSRLVIPGTVSHHKKYDRLVRILLQYSDVNEVIFLGKIDNTYQIEFEKLKEQIFNETSCTIIYFKDYVDDSIFEEFLCSSKYCFVDYEPEIITKEGYLERFAVSKESGAFWLAAKYKMRLISPSEREDIPGLITYGVMGGELTNC